MMWPENRSDKVEKWLGDALEAARQRTGDEIARRRVWAQIENLPLKPEEPLRRSRSFALPAMTGALVVLGAVALLWLVPGADPGQVSQTPPSAAVVAQPTSSPLAPSPIVPETNTPPIRTGHEKARVALPGGAVVELDANSVLSWDAQRRPQVERGQARFEVAHQSSGHRFVVAAGPYLISVVGTRFHVAVAKDRVSVDVDEGVVEVSRGDRTVRLSEGDSWAGSVQGAVPSAAERRVLPGAVIRRASRGANRPSAAATPSLSSNAVTAPVADDSTAAPAAPAERPLAHSSLASASAELKQARAALNEGRSEDALEILAHCAQGTGPAAENAAYEMGRVLRDRLYRPKAAIAAWGQYRTRFPNGLLRAETDLSIMETWVSLGERKSALAEAEAFLSRHPHSERREEVSRLAARLRATTGP